MNDHDELLATARLLAARLGRNRLSQAEFARLCGLPGNAAMRAHRRFGGWREFCRAAGLVCNRPPRVPVPDDEIFTAMRDAFLAIKGVGPLGEFAKHFRYDDNVLYRRGWKWPMALYEFRKWAERNDPGFPYMDQLPVAPPKPTDTIRGGKRANAVAQRVPGRPVYGEPFAFRCFSRAPSNETGVAMLFAVVAADFGFVIEASQQGFPDCDALCRIGENRWQRVRIEFEFRSRNFADHRHDPKGCDLIVCWEDDWGADAPVPVFELKSRIRALMGG